MAATRSVKMGSSAGPEQDLEQGESDASVQHRDEEQAATATAAARPAGPVRRVTSAFGPRSRSLRCPRCSAASSLSLSLSLSASARSHRRTSMNAVRGRPPMPPSTSECCLERTHKNLLGASQLLLHSNPTNIRSEFSSNTPRVVRTTHTADGATYPLYQLRAHGTPSR